VHFIHYLKFQNPPYAPVKYALQAVRTLQVLFSEYPDVVFVQNPPFVCGLFVYLYCRLSSARFVLDHHSAAFARGWDWALSIQKFLARRAITNVVTNQHWVDILCSWSADAFVLEDPLVVPQEVQQFAIAPGFNVAYINTFAADEPLDAVLQAASRLSEVHFYITGDTSKKPDGFFQDCPSNVTFTGFLPDAQYFGLLTAAQAVMALTTRDHTLQCGGIEAVSLGKPLIVSDWPYLRSLFPGGSIYVRNSSNGIREGILLMQEQHEAFEREMQSFAEQSRREWDAQLGQLKQIIASQ